jgi:hypothetical protein
MPLPFPEDLFDAQRMSDARTIMPTDLSTSELRTLGADVLARAVFCARGTNAIFLAKLQEVVGQIGAGMLSDGQARTALYEVLDTLGYDAEKGGFQGEEVPPALKGTLQDLRSFRRMDLIVRTQRQLMQGSGEQWSGQQPDRLREYPALMLVRFVEAKVPRDWPSRYRIAFGHDPLPGFSEAAYKTVGAETGLVALKGDPGWGELGSYENFPDALGVDHAPFYFNSEMWTREISMARAIELGVTGPDGESPEEWIESGKGVTLAGNLPALPRPRLSLAGVDPEISSAFQRVTRATPVTGRPGVMDYSDILAQEIAAHDEAYYPKGGGQ